MTLDLLIIGGGTSGLSCALVIGSGLKMPFANSKKTAIISHQKSSHLQNALFNNVLGLVPGTKGSAILVEGKKHLNELYPEVIQIDDEKVLEIIKTEETYFVKTNKNTYKSRLVVLALNYSNPFTIKGLEEYIIPHQLANPKKDRIQLKNENHLIETGLYCCGTIAGWRSQFSIASGSGAQVATDILTLWNDGKHTKIHDKI